MLGILFSLTWYNARDDDVFLKKSHITSCKLMKQNLQIHTNAFIRATNAWILMFTKIFLYSQ